LQPTLELNGLGTYNSLDVVRLIRFVA